MLCYKSSIIVPYLPQINQQVNTFQISHNQTSMLLRRSLSVILLQLNASAIGWLSRQFFLTKTTTKKTERMHTVDTLVSDHKTVSSASMSQTCPPFPKAQPTLPSSSTIGLSTFMTLLPGPPVHSDGLGPSADSRAFPDAQDYSESFHLKAQMLLVCFPSAEKVITASWSLLNAPTSAWAASPAYLLLCHDVVCTSPPPCPLLATPPFFSNFFFFLLPSRLTLD